MVNQRLFFNKFSVAMTLIVASLVLAWGVAFAADNGVELAEDPLVIELTQYAVIPAQNEGEDDQLILLGAEEMSRSGTMIEYRVTVKNVSDEAVSDLVLELPIPQGTDFVEESESYDRFVTLLQFSIDGGTSFRNPPVRYVVLQDDGTEVEMVATADMYTDLRLVFLRAISPDEEVEAAYRVAVR